MTMTVAKASKILRTAGFAMTISKAEGVYYVVNDYEADGALIRHTMGTDACLHVVRLGDLNTHDLLDKARELAEGGRWVTLPKLDASTVSPIQPRDLQDGLSPEQLASLPDFTVAEPVDEVEAPKFVEIPAGTAARMDALYSVVNRLQLFSAHLASLPVPELMERIEAGCRAMRGPFAQQKTLARVVVNMTNGNWPEPDSWQRRRRVFTELGARGIGSQPGPEGRPMPTEFVFPDTSRVRVDNNWRALVCEVGVPEAVMDYAVEWH